ncbi:flagellar protein FliT [Pseudogulbenkiania ferrooxidans]|uniref:Flagellar protein FliT n=1 Tax=Pseudogulbenkiania ferrooxidans 2002 TaxID=279714 RepID=B9Z882_9NEIS|nr:flagellar protein FliT [Pseudogulbenkiania ferrooxidans]EEG06985.1 hypothetical protein FuraDRAFT_3568 [Pseudogulbenkiania ferrooxidans 2002]
MDEDVGLSSQVMKLAHITEAMLAAASNAEWERFTELDIERDAHYRQVILEVDAPALANSPELREVLDTVVTQSREIESLLIERCAELQYSLSLTNRQQKLQKIYR